MRYPPLQAPLLWQVYLGFWIAGIAAVEWLWPALCCALLLALAEKRLWHTARLALAAALVLAGLGAAHWRMPQEAQPPAWLRGDKEKTPVRLCGTVRDVQGLPDNRLRVILAGVGPKPPARAPGGAEGAASDSPLALPGLTAWTWEQPLLRPLAGQTVCLSRRPRAVRGFANAGLADWGRWWLARGVQWQVRSRAERGEPAFLGPGSLSARWREDLRRAFLGALAPGANGILPTSTQDAAAPGDAAPAGKVTPAPFAEQPELPQGKAILVALLFGDRQYLSQSTLDNFAAATLVHSLALSGQHLAVAGLLGLLCVLAAARLHPTLYLARPRAIWAVAAALPPAVAYLWLGNAPASLLRAVCMLFALMFWLLRGRPRTTLDVLCAALLCITLVSPLSVLDTGLQLSALCVAVIGLFLPWLRRVLPEPDPEKTGIRAQAPWRRGCRGLLRILLISLLIQAALLPLNLLLFGNAGFWFPLNVLWLPAADLLVLPGAVLGLALAGAGLESAARCMLDLAALPCQWLTDGLAWLDGHGLLQNPALLRPHWTALPAFAALLAALAFKAGRPKPLPAARRLLLAGMILLCLGPLLRAAERFSGETRVSVLDVGQSQAVAVRLPGHLRLLLDGGGSASPRFDPGRALAVPALTYNDAPCLTAVCNSHPDLDHMGGLLYLLRHCSVRALFDNGREGAGARGAEWAELRQALGSRVLAEGDVLALGDPALGLRLEVLHPPRLAAMPRYGTAGQLPGREDKKGREAAKATEEQAGHAPNAQAPTDWSGNDASLVLRLTRRGRGLALFTGDAERPALRRLLASGRDLKAEVLVAPHHGSDRSFLAAFYRAVQPQLVLASCGFQNRYGYPGPRLAAWLAKHGIPLLHTGESGQITVIWPERGSLRISTARP